MAPFEPQEAATHVLACTHPFTGVNPRLPGPGEALVGVNHGTTCTGCGGTL